MRTEIAKRCTVISTACNDSPITGYFRQLIAEKTGIVLTPETDPETIRAMICEVEAQMIEAVAKDVLVDANPEYKLVHHFTPGVYGREMHIPAGHVVVGKLHKHELLNIITEGKVLVLTEQFGLVEYTAPAIFTSPRGTKRLLLTLSDTVWTGIHPTESKDLEQIESDFIAKSYIELQLEAPARLTKTQEAICGEQ